MGFFYISLFMGTILLFFVNVYWLGINLYFYAANGLDWLLQGQSFIESIYGSVYLRWILFADLIWLCVTLLFAFQRKHYKTDPDLHYLKYDPIQNKKICVILPTYNEEKNVASVVKDFLSQKYVSQVIVVDNHSEDDTVQIAKNNGAVVVEKLKNTGFTDSCIRGFSEALKTNLNIITICDCDQTFSAYDLEKMVPFLDNCDTVIGTRQIQVLSEIGNQNSTFYIWGNLFLAKLMQIKYFSLKHIGIVDLSDVGCTYRCFSRQSLEKILPNLQATLKNKQNRRLNFSPIALLMTMISIENDLRIVEVPITFKKRSGVSKSQAEKKSNGIKYGLNYLWLILSR